VDFREALRLVERTQRGFRHQDLPAHFDPLAVGVACPDRRAMPLEEPCRAAAMVEEKRLLLDLRFQGEGTGTSGRWQACRHLIGVVGATGTIVESGGFAKTRREHDAHRLSGAASARPHGRLHATLGRQFLRQRSGGGRLQQLQHPIQVRLADAVGTDEDSQASGREADRAQRAVVGGVNLADNQSTSRAACRHADHHAFGVVL
jgi:hypothetical protein